MLKAAVFTLIDSLNRYAGAAYRNGHISKAESRRFIRSLTLFRLKGLFNLSRDRLQIAPYNFNFLDPHSFSFNFEEVFLEEEYFFLTENPEPVIIDCGSNIGLATIYFKTIYPAAKIIAIEAHPTTYKTLEKNIADNKLADVEALNVAVVGGNETEISLLSSKPGDLRSTKIREMRDDASNTLTEIKVPAIKLSAIMPESVNLLKIDIEGSEDEVIDDLAPELGRVENIIIEYHATRGTGRKSLGKFITILESAGFSCRMKAANPADKDAIVNGGFVVTIYGSRKREV